MPIRIALFAVVLGAAALVEARLPFLALAADPGHAAPAKTNAHCAKVSADSLVANMGAFQNRVVEVEGLIVHVCGVDGRKMKLRAEGGAVIEIVPRDSLAAFDGSFHGKRVKARGIAGESRVGRSDIERMSREKALLCHIDHTPCRDTSWVGGQRASGSADTLSKRDIEKLTASMERSGKSYVPVIVIYADKVEIIEEAAK